MSITNERDVTAEDVIIIAAPWPEPTKQIERIRTDHPGIQVHYIHTPTNEWSFTTVDKDLLKTATIFCTQYSPTTEETPKLEIHHLFSAGINHVIGKEEWTREGLSITTSSGIHGPQIAEWAIMYLLMSTHRARTLEQLQRESHWREPDADFMIRDLSAQRVGVLSYGSIGRQTARIAHALAMEVYAYTATPRNTPESKKDSGYIVPGTGDPEGEFPAKWFSGMDKKSLHEFLASDLDVLVFCVPSSKDSKHMLGKEEFDVLKKAGKNTFFINVGRGDTIVQDELVKALKTPLKEGGLRGAALDVTDPEPLPSSSELWGIENLFISPHCSGYTADYAERSLGVLEMNLKLRARGKKLINEVDRKKGY